VYARFIFGALPKYTVTCSVYTVLANHTQYARNTHNTHTKHTQDAHNATQYAHNATQYAHITHTIRTQCHTICTQYTHNTHTMPHNTHTIHTQYAHNATQYAHNTRSTHTKHTHIAHMHTQVAAKYFLEKGDGVYHFRPQFTTEQKIADIEVRRNPRNSCWLRN